MCEDVVMTTYVYFGRVLMTYYVHVVVSSVKM